MIKRLHILHKLPTPYNDDFFRALHEAPDIDLQVYHLWRGSERRPWKQQLGIGYPNRYMEPFLGIDLPSFRSALMDRESLFMFGDWAHAPPLALIGARLAAGAPLALWVDTPQEDLYRPVYKRIPRARFLRWLLPRMDIIFASGKPARRVLREMGARPESLVDLQFFVDLRQPELARKNSERVAASRNLRRRIGCENGCVFAMAGTVDLAKKAQDVGLRAFVRMREMTSRPIGLLIAGSGRDEPALRDLARRLNLGREVAFLGWQEPEEMEAVFLASDVLIHPAHYDPFPLVVIEAMAFGRPVIGSDRCGSVEERVVQGINGFSFPAGDVESLSSAMLELASDAALLANAKAAARATAEAWPMERGVEIVRQALQSISPG
jgi:glycosyltransferase involved in cell wall biosynthesis